MTNRIARLEHHKSSHLVVFTDSGSEFKPTAVPSNEHLKYVIEKGHESYLHSYFMQVNALQQFSLEEESLVKRYLQNVHGYFARSNDYPTELILSTSWDSNTLKDKQIFFYRVDVETCEPSALDPR